MWSVPPAWRGMRWSATHGSPVRGPSPHSAHTVATALILAESRPYVPVRLGGFGWSGQRLPVRVGLPHMLQVFHITIQFSMTGVNADGADWTTAWLFNQTDPTAIVSPP